MHALVQGLVTFEDACQVVAEVRPAGTRRVILIKGGRFRAVTRVTV
jgi:hypothetical protein